MKSKQRRARDRWREALVGGLAGLGVPMLLLGMAGGRRAPAHPATVGAVAGLLGALVGGGLARRPGERPSLRQVEPVPLEEHAPRERTMRLEPPQEDAPEPRRGPSGRERHWLLREAVGSAS
ncbi:hypothetical protein [Hyalangium gracile]|uniref:hypothetical protein n=1 Tax=Hyalangium gracile TaxID=394092 RepID=UPI001CCCE2C2|nr:hypothetical protein [Hyalangium gracile]